MTVEAMSSLPFQAGSAVAAAAGRTALWVISAYMRQPLRNTALAALIGLSAMAGSNALYKQSHHHPAPLFGSFDAATPVPKKAKATVMPAERPIKLAQPISQETTGSVDEPVSAASLIGQDDVLMLQQKLLGLGLFTGSVDGLFGPRTAKAIKAYEASVGRTPRGLLTPAIITLIRSTEDAPAAPVVAPAIAITPAIAVTADLQPVTAGGELSAKPLPLQQARPLPAPAPLLTAAQAAIAPDAALVPDAAIVPDGSDPVLTATAEDSGDAAAPLALQSTKSAIIKRAVPTIAVRVSPKPAAETQQMPTEISPISNGVDASNDPTIVASVQQGLNNLGFLHQQVDGVAGEATSKAIRNFEVYFNYDVTGRVTRQLVNLLQQNGADI